MKQNPTTSKRDEYAAWFERRKGPRNLAIEEEILAIASVYDEAMETGILTEEQLQKVSNGVSRPNGLMWNSTSSLLRRLAERWPIAGEAIMQLSLSRKAHVRFAAICCLGKGVDERVVDAVLKAGFVDIAAKVRSKSGEVGNALSRRNLVPDLEAALSRETNELVKASLELSLHMLRDGFWIKSMPDGRKDVIVSKPGRGISSKAYSEKELSTKGIESIIEELRRD